VDKIYVAYIINQHEKCNKEDRIYKESPVHLNYQMQRHTLNHSRSTDIIIAHIQYKARQYANTDCYTIFNAGFTFFVSVKASLRFQNNAAIEVAPV